MPRKRRTNPFLDLEVDVDDDEQEVESGSEGEDQDSMLDYFIPDEVEDDPQSTAFKTWAELLQEDELEQEEETASFMKHLQDRLNERATPNVTTVAGRSSDGTILVPAYPLYRVACVPGQEESVMFFIYQKIRQERIASIIVRPTIVGYVYVEGMLDGDVKSLLMKTPGIRKTKNGPVTEGIAQGDWSKVLSMKGRAEKAVVGQWVTVRDGSIYDGDVGLVVRVESWGVELLVVPRIPSVMIEREVLEGASVMKKRKRMQVLPEARLWLEPDEAKSRGWDVEETSPNCYKVGTSKFEYGLLRGFCSFYGIRPGPPVISSSTFFNFASSNHPLAISAQYYSPKPQEWAIRHKDFIKDFYSGRRGRVHKIEATFAEMEAEDGSGLFSVPWKALRKVVGVGDYVDIASGPYKERNGWVIAVNGDIATIVTTQDHKVLHVEAHVNWIGLSSTPFVSSTYRSSGPSVIPKDHLPWVGLRVLIVKTAHKGRHGTIQNWFSRGDDYGLVVRLEEYNPNAPFHDLTLGYGDVVEAK
ncbi:hypothetical protein BJ165DRAFT_1532571 [Panaeolus papilionaceus]|nr:hypothetical protein BJ165DRAFT_1532571 [Panaeolus papilionaceus]